MDKHLSITKIAYVIDTYWNLKQWLLEWGIQELIVQYLEGNSDKLIKRSGDTFLVVVDMKGLAVVELTRWILCLIIIFCFSYSKLCYAVERIRFCHLLINAIYLSNDWSI